jgi:hypothetical protein
MFGMQTTAGAVVDPNGGGAHLPVTHPSRTMCYRSGTGPYTTNCYTYTYPRADITYSVDVAPGMPSYASQIDQAAQLWYNTPTALYPARVTDPNQARVHIHVVNGTNGYLWGYTQWSSTYTSSGNTITQDDIWLYAPQIQRNWNGDNTILAGVIAHEMGHALGLQHPGYCTQSIMVPGNAGCPTYNSPQQSDINDINSLYK